MIEDKHGVLGKPNSREVTACMVCDGTDLRSVLFLGFLPPVNLMQKAGRPLSEQPAYPAELLYCPQCALVQLGLVVSASILFPAEYPYTSSTTRVLRDNFADLSREVRSLLAPSEQDLIVDIGSNDGNLLSNFKDHMRVVGITPEDIGKIAVQRGIPTFFGYFGDEAVSVVLRDHGKAKIVAATNVFAHIDGIHEVVGRIRHLLTDDGVFISESHYLNDLVEGLQYDAIYHEHLRYYSVRSLQYLLDMHGLEVFHVKRIPSHGGSIRVYAARPGKHAVRESVAAILAQEDALHLNEQELLQFRQRVLASKLDLLAMLREVKNAGNTIYGISAPSRASTLINYAGIDDGMIDCVLEVDGSHKIGNYVPGTRIPIVNESILLEKQPDCAILFSWHIADELVPKLRQKGFRGRFIVPLPRPRFA